MFSLESPHRGDSNENTQYIIFNINTKNHPKLSQICSDVIFSTGLKNEFEIAMVTRHRRSRHRSSTVHSTVLMIFKNKTDITFVVSFGGIISHRYP